MTTPTQIPMRERLRVDYAWTPRQKQVLDLMDRVARTGEPERSESYISDIDRYIRFQTSRVEGADSRNITVDGGDLGKAGKPLVAGEGAPADAVKLR